MRYFFRFINIFRVFEKVNKSKVAISVCGSGGHVIPGLVVADALMRNGFDVTIFVDKRGYNFIEKNKHSIPLENIIIVENVSFVRSLANVKNTLLAIIFIFEKLKQKKIYFVISFGSYLGLISVIAGFLSRVKIAVHQADTIFGFANKISSFFADFIFLGFRAINGGRFFNFFNKKKLIYTGNPLRSDILSYCFDKSYNINYRAIYDIIDSDVINLLILGGSQGSYVLSNKISNSMAFLGLFLKNRINIFHQAKQEDVPSLQSYYDNIGVKASVFSFNSDIGHLMSQCHLCITRSGASTLSELACIGVPAILIPMKYSANNHQFFNAQYFKNKDAAIVLEEDGLHPEGLAIFLSDIFAKNTLLFTLRERIKDEGNLLAKENIVRFIEMICRGQGSIVCKDYIRGSHSVDKGFVIK